MNQRVNENKIEKGSQAAMVEALVGPFINERVSQIIQKMVSSYRGGKTEHDRLVGYAAQITAMFDLISDLEGIQRQGFIAAEKEMSNATEEEENREP